MFLNYVNVVLKHGLKPSNILTGINQKNNCYVEITSNDQWGFNLTTKHFIKLLIFQSV